MTASDELLRLLNKRGVEWQESYDDASDLHYFFWQVGKVEASFCAWGKSSTHFEAFDMSPTQAIEATLGRGTCTVEGSHSYDTADGPKWYIELSCHTLDEWPDKEPPLYCPWCGARVEVVDE